MSQLSGKADLYTHICFEKTYDKGSYKESDILECFEIFKKKTGGVIYQHKPITVTVSNQNYWSKELGFEIVKHKSMVPDFRYKNHFRENIHYTYTYHDKEYKSLKDLNKQNLYFDCKIRFDTLIDLIPYFPYLVTIAACTREKETIFIANKSYVESQFEESFNFSSGPNYSSFNYYRTELSNLYRDVILKYFNPAGRMFTETFTVDSDLSITVGKRLDTNFEIEVERKSHEIIYDNPRIVNKDIGLIDVSLVWPGELKPGDSITITYVVDINQSKKEIL